MNNRAPESTGPKLLTVLVADDDRGDGLLLRRAFSKQRVSVALRVVTDGEEAIRYLAGSGPYSDRVAYPLPDLIVLDLSMPRMGGLDVLRWIGERLSKFDMPVVVLTGSALPGDMETVLRAGAKAFLIKPQDSADLAEVVRSILSELQQPA